jgi:hypothetical protein
MGEQALKTSKAHSSRAGAASPQRRRDGDEQERMTKFSRSTKLVIDNGRKS